jgi:glycosyltransferase involved in cell wall biosynthesis
VSRPLQVAFLTSARTWRGSGVSLASVAQGLQERGHTAHMLAGDAQVVDAFAALGLPAGRVPTGNTGIREVRALASVLGEIGADVILVDRPRDLRLAALASVVHPVSIVNKYNLSRPRPPRDLLTRLAYRQVGLTVFVSETLAERALAQARYLRRRPHRVIREAVDAEWFRPDLEAAREFRAATGLGAEDFVLAVGSLTLDKGYDFLLDAWARLGSSAPSLLICGEGAHRERLRARTRDLGVDARFLGHLGPDLLRGAYNAACCFVHAGKVETFGLSVLEAMACGRPVLAIAGGAIPEVLGDTGLLAPADTETFIALLRELLGDEARRTSMGDAARRRALQHFSMQRMRQAYASAIESVAGDIGG